jgi:hypothetical protein
VIVRSFAWLRIASGPGPPILERPSATASERGSVILNDQPTRPPAPSRSGRRRLLRIGLRAAISVLIVVFLPSRTNIDAVKDSLSHSRPGYVAMAFAALLLGLVVNAIRARPR